MSSEAMSAPTKARHLMIHGENVRRIYPTPFGVDVILTNGDAVSIAQSTLSRLGYVAEDYRRQARRRNAGLRPGVPALDPAAPLVAALLDGDEGRARELADAHEAALPVSERLSRKALRWGDWAQALAIVAVAGLFVLGLAYVGFGWLYEVVAR